MRQSQIMRKTAETDVTVTLCLDGSGKATVQTGAGFFDHMLTLFAVHGGFDLTVHCTGDTYVDDHHSVEDVGICLGQAFSQALGDKRGIMRYGDTTLPMDEALILCAVDLSGRPYLRYSAQIPTQKVGTFDTELVKEFFMAFAMHAGLALHIRQLDGENSHHIIEGMFKAAARALRAAVKIDSDRPGAVPSSKGVL